MHHIGALPNWHGSCMRLNANENHSHLRYSLAMHHIGARATWARTMGAWARDR